MPASTTPPAPSPSVTAVHSRHAPPKAGTAEQAYRKAKGKARRRLKDQKRRDTAPYGDIMVKPRLVEKHIKTPATPIRTRLDAHNLPHTSTSYLGMRDSSLAGKVFQLDELVGEDSMYGFELRKWDGR